MNMPPVIPPIASRRAIVYELSRWDIFANWMTVIIRNRILQVFVLVALIANEWLFLAPEVSKQSFSRTLLAALVYLILFLAFMIGVQCVLGLANAFLLKHRGVMGRHVLEITEQGLVERTDCNETLHRWPAIGRILSIGGYLFIYVGDNISHQVPKRSFSPQEIEAFELDLCTHMKASI